MRVRNATVLTTLSCHANPGGQGPPPGLEAQIDAFAPALGPVAISAFAEKLTVATMALIDVRLPDPPLAQTIEAVISIEQTMRVTPFEGPQEEQTMPPLVHELRRTRLPLEIGKVGRLRELVRLPRATPKDAGFGSWEQWSPIRATTLEASQTPIRTSHRVRPITPRCH